MSTEESEVEYIEKAKVVDLIKSLECGLFADRETVEEARQFALDLLKASSPDERDMCTHTALGVYQNTLAKELLRCLNS